VTTELPVIRRKVCSDPHCECQGTPQLLDAFGRNDAAPDGRAYYCRKCASRKAAEWKRAHPGKVAEWRRNYVARNKAKNAARRAAAEDETRYVDTE
jgi:hypothetical protein